MSKAEDARDETLHEAVQGCGYLVGRSPLPTVVTEGERHIVRYANAAFCSLIGKASADLMGRPFADIIPQTEHNASVSLLDRVYRTGEPEIVTDQGSPLSSGTAIYWSHAAWPLLDPEQRPACVALQVTDITAEMLIRHHYEQAGAEIRQINQELLISTIREQELAELAVHTEQQLLQAHKMEGIGRLAGGIAHDFNNLLTAILGFTELAEETVAPEDEAQGYLRSIRGAVERAAILTNQLLAFARKQVVQPQIVDINVAVLDIDQLLRRLIGANIELVIVCTSDVGNIRIDPGQLGQILINLVVNARDAISRDGTITIETARITLDAGDAHRNPELPPGDYMVLSVSDTGTGISEEMQAHLFEPFFTNKQQGKGTGLGLATCYGIVKQSGGQITFTTEPGKGTTFHITLPRVTEAANPVQSEGDTPLPRGTEIIFFVEDEEAIRAHGARTLRRQGYTVFEAENGSDALRQINAYPGRIDLLVTDVLMPQMGGIELADRLCPTRPEVKVLFISGYTNEALVHQGILDQGLMLLQKPFTSAALAHRVRQTLDRGDDEVGRLHRIVRREQDHA
jgi:PAS domain S-box-containing protein